MTADFAIEPLAEDTLLLRFGDSIDIETNARVHAVARALRHANLPGITDIAPAYASLMIRFDPLTLLDCARTQPMGRIEACMRSAIDAAVGEPPPPHPPLAPEQEPVRGRGFEKPRRPSTLPLPQADSPRGDDGHGPDAAADDAARPIEIPVCYGGESGPDLEAVARHAEIDPDQVVARHVAIEYTVAMLGFAPGFPYLLGLDAALHVPRRANPRTRVPAGSVAIGGAQTGIYPGELPGGWNLIGQTPLVLFDPQREPPCLLAPGDRVRFRAVGADEFRRRAGRGG
ncbi:MAG: 5-oxoprolinase subunit PxpB [Rhodanobacteraceae bacterium]